MSKVTLHACVNKSLQKQKSIFLFFRNSNGVLSLETIMVFAHKVICQVAVLPNLTNLKFFLVLENLFYFSC